MRSVLLISYFRRPKNHNKVHNKNHNKMTDQKLQSSIFTRDDKGFLKLTREPDFNRMGSFSRKDEERIEKEIETIRQSLVVDWDQVNKIRFNI
jgi:hypothetical protein